MLIQPIQPVYITINIGDYHYEAQLVSLSDTQLELSCSDYLDTGTPIAFRAKYFKGHAIISETQFCRSYFIYKLKIESIQFQPGLIINTRL